MWQTSYFDQMSIIFTVPFIDERLPNLIAVHGNEI